MLWSVDRDLYLTRFGAYRRLLELPRFASPFITILRLIVIVVIGKRGLLGVLFRRLFLRLFSLFYICSKSFCELQIFYFLPFLFCNFPLNHPLLLNLRVVEIGRGCGLPSSSVHARGATAEIWRSTWLAGSRRWHPWVARSRRRLSLLLLDFELPNVRVSSHKSRKIRIYTFVGASELFQTVSMLALFFPLALSKVKPLAQLSLVSVRFHDHDNLSSLLRRCSTPYLLLRNCNSIFALTTLFKLLYFLTELHLLDLTSKGLNLLLLGILSRGCI